VRRGKGIGLVCGWDIAVFVLVDWEEKQGLVNLWIVHCWLFSGREGRGTGVGLFCGFDIAGCVVVDWEEGELFV
jgi:hypothetical protein